MSNPEHIIVTFRGKEHQIAFHPGCTAAELLAELAKDIPGLAPHTLKLIISKPKSLTLHLSKQLDMPVSVAGVLPDARVMLLGSFTAELQRLAAHHAAEASLRLPSFEYEATRTAQRRRGAASAASMAAAADAAGRFGSFKVLPFPAGAPPSAPTPSAALALLHRIAADPAIISVMTSHGWKVGLLSEMPPEGKVGVSAVCVLGYNVNRGQEISLRLRTDDYRGFRKYLRIRETLVHELAHMVFDEHDSSFKALNSQLLKEVQQHEAAAAGGRTLAGSSVFGDSWLGGDGEQHSAAAPAASERGRVLAAREGSNSSSSLLGLLNARESAAAAAMARWQQQQQQQPSSAAAAAAASSATGSAGVQQEPEPAAAAAASSTVDGMTGWAEAGDAADEDDGLTDEPATAAAEEAMRRLGSFEPGAEADLNEQEGEQQQQQQQQQAAKQQQQQQQQQQQDQEVEEGVEQQEQQLRQISPQQKAELSQQQRHSQPHCNASQQQQQQQQQHPNAGDEAMPFDGDRWSAQEAASDGSIAAADSSDMDAAGDDVVAAKLQSARQLLQQLVSQAGSSALGAVQAVAGVLSSIAEHPGELKYQRLRCCNAAFQKKLGQYPAASQLLLLAGFAERPQRIEGELQQSSNGRISEPVLVYARSDPGLLWLVLSVVRSEESRLLMQPVLN